MDEDKLANPPADWVYRMFRDEMASVPQQRHMWCIVRFYDLSQANFSHSNTNMLLKKVQTDNAFVTAQNERPITETHGMIECDEK